MQTEAARASDLTGDALKAVNDTKNARVTKAATIYAEKYNEKIEVLDIIEYSPDGHPLYEVLAQRVGKKLIFRRTYIVYPTTHEDKFIVVEEIGDSWINEETITV